MIFVVVCRTTDADDYHVTNFARNSVSCAVNWLINLFTSRRRNDIVAITDNNINTRIGSVINNKT